MSDGRCVDCAGPTKIAEDRPTSTRTSATTGWTILAIVVVGGLLTRTLWLPAIANSLVCTEEVVAFDAVLVENFVPDYRLFERAAALQREGVSARVLVPTPTSSSDSLDANLVSRGIVELMAGLAGVQHLEIVPIKEIEPYSLNAARQIRDFFAREHIRSVLVMSPAFRSRRSSLVYRAVLGPAGVRVSCLAIFGQHTPGNWTTSWHGIQAVAEQLIKLQFYRFYVVVR
jgi:hypothetical protein